MKRLTGQRLSRYRSQGPVRALYPQTPENVSDYFAILDLMLRDEAPFWFRGHAAFHWTLTPSALRYTTEEERNKALGLINDFKRFVEIKLPKPPAPDEGLKWAQLAQHYGLPTRLLDWTENPAVALYFACKQNPDADAILFVLNPIDLNRLSQPKRPRVLDAHRDADVIGRYLSLSGRIAQRAKPPVAVHPVWNSDRIMLQQGVFTLHGGQAALTSRQVPSLLAIPILREHKEKLLLQLERIGIHEMAIFPEPEHTCSYLKQHARF